MSLTGPLDFFFAVIFAVRRFGILRTVLFSPLLVPAYLYSLPPQSCGCLRTPFVRCAPGGRGRMYLAATKSDLKNLASQQEIYFSDHGTFSADPDELAFVTSDGVSVVIEAVSDRGWRATATHAALEEGGGCSIYWGDAPPWSHHVGQPGEVVCAT